MPADYLHNHPQFADLMRIVAQEKAIDPALCAMALLTSQRYTAGQ